ncbi:MAG: hypothetical protein IJ097_01705 [Bacilli bacterium]|nr:hypothetical protein [Bacilli bacterium]
MSNKVIIETDNGIISINFINNRLYFESDNSIIKINSSEEVYNQLNELYTEIRDNISNGDKPFIKDKIVYYSDEVNYIDDDYASSMTIYKDDTDDFIILFKEGFDTLGNKTSKIMINTVKSKYKDYTEYFVSFYNKLLNINKKKSF